MNQAISVSSVQATTAPAILVVDDEASIRRTLEGVLRDEGFDPWIAADGVEALKLLAQRKPALVLLDIWMPGSDGVEILGKIRALYPDLPVIMISGHATIATAIMATRRGAVDFIEKPLDLEMTLGAVRRALNSAIGLPADQEVANETKEGDAGFELGRASESIPIDPVVFQSQAWRGAARTQKTLARSALLYGQGLHSGKKSGLILEALPPNSGIHFVGVSERRAVPAHLDYVESTGFATTVRFGSTQAGTIEHLMSALHAFGITNLLIKCNGEVPVMDGSSREFCALIEDIGIEKQPGDWFEIAVPHTIRIGNDEEFIQIEPSEGFSIDYQLSYPAPLGEQSMSFTLGDVPSYKREIANARTFGFVKDIGALQRQGLALGGRFDNFVLFGPEGAINDKLRYGDEPVRHKILDAIGDLYLLGRPLRGHVTARMTGHSDNIALLGKIHEGMRGE